MPFTAALWADLISRNGETIRWWRQEYCSCHDPQSRQWDRGHSVCGGAGVVLTEQTISAYKAIVAAKTLDLAMDLGGRRIDHLLLVETLPAQIPLAEGDEVQLQGTNRVIRREEVLRKGKDDSTLHDIVAVTQVRRNSTIYTLTTDFAVSGNDFTWVSGHGPATGETYAVIYTARPRYEVHAVTRRGTTGVLQTATCLLRQAEEVSLGISG